MVRGRLYTGRILWLDEGVLGIFQNLGAMEIFLILLIVLLLFGAKRLPELSRSIGKSFKEFKKATSEAEEQFKSALDEPEKKSGGDGAAPPQGSQAPEGSAQSAATPAEPAPAPAPQPEAPAPQAEPPASPTGGAEEPAEKVSAPGGSEPRKDAGPS